MGILYEKSSTERNSFTWEGEMALAKMRMSITSWHLDSHSTNINLIPSNQEFSNLILKLCYGYLTEEDNNKGSDLIYHNL